MICPTGEAKYFCKWDWTGQITLIRFNKFGRARKRRSGLSGWSAPRNPRVGLRAQRL
jgi:hypothetical protein